MGIELLSFLEQCQARVWVALAALPADARSDRMLTVAQRFVDAAYQATAANNWVSGADAGDRGRCQSADRRHARRQPPRADREVHAQSFAGQAFSETQSAAGFLGFTNTAATATSSAVTATQALGRTILAGTALVGSASGIAQSAANGDALGVAAGVLEVAAAVAGGLVSTNEIPDATNLGALLQGVAVYGGIASLATSGADAFIHGDIAGELASSLNALTQLVAASVPVQSDKTKADGSIITDYIEVVPFGKSPPLSLDAFSLVEDSDLGTALNNGRLKGY